jgi:uncharacterized membrane protein YfcA
LTLPFGLDVVLAALGVGGAIAVPLVVLAAYTVFGLTGFGSSVVAVPLLAHLLPLAFVVPLQLVLDFTAALTLGSRVRAQVDRAEMAWLLPFMLVGMAAGVTLLVRLPRRATLAALGVLALAYGLLGLFGRASQRRWSRAWAAPIAIFGGVASALFGTGGPVYVIYLSRRIRDTAVLRATIAAVVLASAIARLAVFGVTGLLGQPGLAAFAALLLPFMAAGVALGSRLHRTIAPARARTAVQALLVASGLSLVARAASG